jgi:hypothetical protein
MTTESNVVKTQKRSKVKCTLVSKGNYQKDHTLTAELRQKVITTSKYPGMQISNDMQQNVFSMDDFDVKPQEFTSEETRVAWIDVPENTTVKDVQDKIPEKATLYRVLSNSPILTNSQKNAISRKLITLDTIANAQVLRYPAGHESEGEIILDPEGRVQYRKIFFWKEHREDQDLRGTTPEYRSKEIIAELGSEPVSVEAELELAESWEVQED